MTNTTNMRAYGCLGLIAACVAFSGIAALVHLQEQSGEFIGWLLITWPMYFGSIGLMFVPLAVALGTSLFFDEAKARYALLAVGATIHVMTAIWLSVPSTGIFWLGTIFLWGIAVAANVQIHEDLRGSVCDDYADEEQDHE